MTEEKNKDDGYELVQTKVPKHVKQLLDMLSEMRGMSTYELLQLLINGFISYAKSSVEVPDEFRHLYESLKFDVAWNKAYNFSSPTAQQDIAQMVLILQQPGRTGFGLAMIDKPYMDDARINLCVPDIFARITELSVGFQDFVQLRQLLTELGTLDILDTVRAMITQQQRINIANADRQELPGYGHHSDYGKVIEYGQRKLQKKHRTPDTIAKAKQMTIRFDEGDRETATNEAQGWDGEHRGNSDEAFEYPDFRPFDVEP